MEICIETYPYPSYTLKSADLLLIFNKVTNKVSKILGKLNRDFFRKRSRDDDGMHNVHWETTQLPKSLGGIGIAICSFVIWLSKQNGFGGSYIRISVFKP